MLSKIMAHMSLFSVIALAASANAGEPTKLQYLKAHDPVALNMYACAGLLTGAKAPGYTAAQMADLVATYKKAGVAAVVKATLELPHATHDRSDAIQWDAPATLELAQNEVKSHMDEAAQYVADTIAAGFDISSICTTQSTLKTATDLIAWRNADTAVLKGL